MSAGNNRTIDSTSSSHAAGHPVVSQPLDVSTTTWFSTLESQVGMEQQQQNQQTRLRPNSRNWSSGLCDCTEDRKICCNGFWCLPCLACQVSQDMGESFCLPCCVPCAYLYVLRTKIRMEQNITGSTMDDCCPVCCCPSCTLCQLARELKYTQRSEMMLTSWRPRLAH
uniref:Uncharacterized protein n=1 Tax=Biomphalaria glabrata TaxID=6526 RepID=A0A2C9KHP4_BIOGL